MASRKLVVQIIGDSASLERALVNIDGKPVTSVVTKHQRKAARRRVTARRGPWAGRT